MSRLVHVAAGLLVLLLLAGCGSSTLAGGGAGRAPVVPDAASLAPQAALPSAEPQAANGPLLGSGDGPEPLAVDLHAPDRIRMPFSRMPAAGLLFDLDSGAVLWRHEPLRRVPIASVTKMMTALLVVDELPEGSKARVTKQSEERGGSRVGLLPLGKRVGVSALLHGLLMTSGNDAATVLAQAVSGTTKRFVGAMNARARAMGLSCTRFVSPDGLDDRGFSCPYDLAALARAVLDEPRLTPILKRRTVALPFPIKGGKLYLSSHNPLLQLNYPGTIGIKTGYTERAGHTFVGAAKRGGRRLGVVRRHPVRRSRLALGAVVGAQVLYPRVPEGRRRTAATHAIIAGLVGTSALEAAEERGGRRAAGLLGSAAAVGYAVELVGVATGRPFGHYAYSGKLGPGVGGVPFMVAASWTAMARPAWIAAGRATRSRGRLARVVAAAAGLTAWDVYIDPRMSRDGFWTWPDGGRYEGVPAQNFLGWFVTALGVYGLWALAGEDLDEPADGGDVALGTYAWTWVGEAIANVAFFGRPRVALAGGLAMGALAAPALRARLRP